MQTQNRICAVKILCQQKLSAALQAMRSEKKSQREITGVTGSHVFSVLVLSSTLRQFARKLEVAKCLKNVFDGFRLMTCASPNLAELKHQR